MQRIRNNRCNVGKSSYCSVWTKADPANHSPAPHVRRALGHICSSDWLYVCQISSSSGGSAHLQETHLVLTHTLLAKLHISNEAKQLQRHNVGVIY